MKKIIPLFLIAMIGSAPTLAQTNALVAGDLLLDKRSYKYDEIIKVTGKVIKITPNTDVSLTIFNPSGEDVWLDQLDVNTDNTFNAEVKAGGPVWHLSGVYTVQASYQTPIGGTITATATFTYTAASSLNKENFQVKTDKSSYSYGEIIKVSGKVKEKLGFPVVLRILEPDGNIVALTQADVDANKKFSSDITMGNASLWNESGVYTVEASYGLTSQNTVTATTTFTFTASSTSSNDDTSSDVGKSQKIKQLEEENAKLKQEVKNLKQQISDLEKKIRNLNSILNEQIQSILKLISKK